MYQNGNCGGSYSEWMHCNGYIGFSAFKSSKYSAVDDIHFLSEHKSKLKEIKFSKEYLRNSDYYYDDATYFRNV